MHARVPGSTGTKPRGWSRNGGGCSTESPNETSYAGSAVPRQRETAVGTKVPPRAHEDPMRNARGAVTVIRGTRDPRSEG
jgi:hypothetical protein